MIAKFEKKISNTSVRTSIFKYRNLHNLLHWHTEHEIIYQVSGEAELNLKCCSYTLKKGMWAFIKSEEIHCITCQNNSITAVIKSSSPALSEITHNKCLNNPIIKNDYCIERYFKEINSELKSNKEYNHLIANSLVTELVAKIFRTEKTDKTTLINEDDEKCKNLLKWMNINYHYINLEDAAKFMHFSKSYFSKYFQAVTGVKFSHFLNSLKVSAAIEYIIENKASMTEISILCGFGTIRNFNRVFKSFTGFTPKSLPKEFINMHSIKNADNLGFDPTLNCSEIIE